MIYLASYQLSSREKGRKKIGKKRTIFSPLSASTPILDREYKPETNKRDNRPPSRKPFARVSITILVHRAYQRSNNLLPPSFPDYYSNSPPSPPDTLLGNLFSPSIVSTRIGHKRRALKSDSSLFDDSDDSALLNINRREIRALETFSNNKLRQDESRHRISISRAARGQWTGQWTRDNPRGEEREGEGRGGEEMASSTKW